MIGRTGDDAQVSGRFYGYTAIVLGAAHGVAQYVVRGLIRRGVFVVAIDRDAATLDRLSSTNPGRIETVVGDPDSEEMMQKVLDEWSDMTLDFLVASPQLDLIDFGAKRLFSDTLRGFGALLAASGGHALCLSDAADEGMFNAYGKWAIAEAKQAFIHDFALEGDFSLDVLPVDAGTSPVVLAARGVEMLTPNGTASRGRFLPSARVSHPFG